MRGGAGRVVGVCMLVRERQTDRQSQRETDRQTVREREREREISIRYGQR